MGWDGPIITDSGGFQVYSLGRASILQDDTDNGSQTLVKITEDGVKFRSHWDGSKHFFTPENVMERQWKFGSDIHIAFDDCTSYPVTHENAKRSLERTHMWAKRSLKEHKRLHALNLGSPSRSQSPPGRWPKDSFQVKKYQALYGSVQGSVYEDLRRESARFISSMDFDGIAIGGVAVGESKKEMIDVLDWVTPILPERKPRHLLGVGEIDDIFSLVEHGIDTFDCVQPTRLARMGRLLAQNENDITKKIFAEDKKPIDPECQCYTCTHFSRAYMHHLFRVRELLAYRLVTIHNLWFIHRLVDDIREAIGNGTFLALKRRWLYNNNA